MFVVAVAEQAAGLLLFAQPTDAAFDRGAVLVRGTVIVAGAEEAEQGIAGGRDVGIALVVAATLLALAVLGAVLVVVDRVPHAIGALVLLEPAQRRIDRAFAALAAAAAHQGAPLAGAGTAAVHAAGATAGADGHEGTSAAEFAGGDRLFTATGRIIGILHGLDLGLDGDRGDGSDHLALGLDVDLLLLDDVALELLLLLRLLGRSVDDGELHRRKLFLLLGLAEHHHREDQADGGMDGKTDQPCGNDARHLALLPLLDGDVLIQLGIRILGVLLLDVLILVEILGFLGHGTIS